MEHLFDVNLAHGNIPDIKENIVAWQFAPETSELQSRIFTLWRNTRNLLHHRARWSTEKILGWKLKRLGELADIAYATVPLYREKYSNAGYTPGAIRSWNDWESLPVVNRTELISGFPSSVTCREFDLGKCRWLTSSGSSGNNVQLVMEPLRADLDQVARYRMFEMMAGAALPPDRWIYNINHAHWWVTSLSGKYPTFTVSQKTPIDSLVEHISFIRPAFISGITSAIGELAASGINLKELGVLAVSTNSESSLRSSRDSWSRTLGVPVLDEYSSEEAGLLAAECRCLKYHLIEDDTHIDIINADSRGIGDVLTTDIWNTVMPVIRYEQGDLAGPIVEDNDCSCGYGGRILTNGLQGRSDEALWSKVRGRIPSGILLELTEDILAVSNQFYQYRLIQFGENDIELIYERRKNSSNSIIYGTLSEFHNKLNETFGTWVNFSYREVTEIDESPRLKRKVILNNLKDFK